jgi:hypothetical protein
MVQVCHNTCHNHPFGAGDCPLNALFRKYLDGWAQICGQVGFYEYYSKGASMGLPWPIVHCIRSDIPYLRQHGGRGFYTQWGRHDLAPAGVNFYVGAKLLWNSRLDTEALLNDFFTKFYGPAAAPMRRVFDRLEERCQRSALHAKGSSDCKYLFVQEWFAPKVLDPCFDDLAEAKRSAGDAEILRRIEVQESVLTYARLMWRYGEEVARIHTQGGGKESMQEAQRRAEEVLRFVKSKSGDGLALSRYADTYLNPVAALKRLNASIAGPW